MRQNQSDNRMKRIYFFFYFLLVFILGISTVGLLTAYNTDTKETHKKTPLTLSMTAAIELPESITLFGQNYPVDDVSFYERLDRELTIFTYQHGSTLLNIKRANRYFPIIEPILKAQGIPDDFKYLAVIESSLDMNAISPAKAAGIWQFMEATGKQYGLEVSTDVDERYHVEKATVAACRYLKSAYNLYGDWLLAAASYNAGKGRISDELTKQKGKTFFDLHLFEETTRYIYRIMAIKEVFRQPYRYGFVLKPNHLYPPVAVNDIMVDKTIPDLALYAKEKGYSYAQLKRFNPWLRSRSLTVKEGKKYTIHLPDKKSLYRKPNSKVKVHEQQWVEE